MTSKSTVTKAGVLEGGDIGNRSQATGYGKGQAGLPGGWTPSAGGWMDGRGGGEERESCSSLGDLGWLREVFPVTSLVWPRILRWGRALWCLSIFKRSRTQDGEMLAGCLQKPQGARA